MLAPGGSLAGTPSASQVMAQDPGYQFRLQQGQKALQAQQSAGGGVLGGGAQKAAMQYGQGFASNEYQNAWNRVMQGRQQQYGMLSGLAGMGEQAAGGLTNAAMTGAGLGTNAAMGMNQYMGTTGLLGTQAAGNMLMQGAGAQAAGDIGAANAWNSMLGGIGNAANSAIIGGFG